MPNRRLGGTMRNELDVQVPVGGGVAVPDDRIPLEKLEPATAASKLIGRQSGSAGDWQEITLGTNLSMSGTTLNATGGGGSGDVVGPGSATDNAVTRFDGTTGKLVQNSAVTIDDSGNIVTAGTVDGRDVSTDGAKLDGIEAGAVALPVVDTTAVVKGSGDATKLVRIEADGISTGTTRVVTMPDQNVDLTPNTGTFPAAAHASRHQSGGADAIKLDDFATPDDNTDLDATTGAHGLLPKLGGGTTNFLRADGAWAAPPGGGGNSFETIAVSGQSNVVADSSTDTLTLVAGSNITITTNAGTDTITIAASGSGSGESFHPFLLAGI